MPKLENEQNEITELRKEIEDLKKLLSEHQHLGSDGSKEMNGTTALEGKELTIHGAGAMRGSFAFLPVNVFDGSKEEGQSRRVIANGIVVSGKGTSNEQILNVLFAGKNLTTEQAEKNNNASNQSDFDEANQASLVLAHSPESALSFLYGYRTPFSGGSGLVITGESTITDENAKYVEGQLVGSYITITNSAGSILETYQITANTETEITIDGTWTSSSLTYTYFIFTPLYLGSANYPFYRGYFIGDIRLGNGSSGGSQVIYIKHGTGSPEGAITANIGSLYLDHTGGESTTLYIKESGNGLATGWIAK